MRAVAALALLAVLATSASAGWRETFNVWERGYITCPVHSFILGSDSVDVTPPIIGGDTLDVRGFMIGVRGIADNDVMGYGYGLRIRYLQSGRGAQRRFDQWEGYKDATNLGMPLIGEYGPGNVTGYRMGMTDFMPLSNVRMLRLLNPSANASMQTVVIWFIDQHDAEAADWSAWTMP